MVLNHDFGGFWPTDDEQRRLEEIDKQLKALLPADDYQLIATLTNDTSTCSQVRQTLIIGYHCDS